MQEELRRDLERIRRVTDINLQELVEAFKLEDRPVQRRLFEPLARIPARWLANDILKFDALIGTDGMATAGAFMLKSHTKGVEVVGREQVPAEGPVLFISNHPGIMDSLALLGHIPRSDLRVLARERDLLAEMPETRKRLIFLTEDNKARFKAMGQAVKHLKNGGAILTFPAGQIEPDPAIYPEDAVGALDDWTESLAMFAHLGCSPTFVPIIVSGVFSKRAIDSPLAKRRSTRAEQEWLSAFLQVIWPPYQDVTVRVEFGEPISAERLRQLPDEQALLSHIRQQVIPLINNC